MEAFSPVSVFIQRECPGYVRPTMEQGLTTMETKETDVQVSMLDVLHEALKLSLSGTEGHLVKFRHSLDSLKIFCVATEGSQGDLGKECL